jgi:multidrug resistance efflux pump
MWSRYVEPPAIVGEVESIHAEIISTVAGTLQTLKVDRLETVTNGQPLAVVTVLDPDQLNAELAAAEADCLVIKARMDVDKTRNLDAYSRLREHHLLEQLNLDLARIRLTQAEAELERAKELFKVELIPRGGTSRSTPGLDVAQRDCDTLRAELAVREKTVAELADAVQHMKSTGTIQVEPADAAVDRLIKAQRERIQRLQEAVVLRSPLDGFVSDINHRPGERITAGLPLLVVSAGASDRIYAWVRQPVTRRPQIGDTVEVRRIAMGDLAFNARVVKVGEQLEKINPSLLLPNRNPERVEVGLPMLLQATEVRRLIPGETVQLRILTHVAASP